MKIFKLSLTSFLAVVLFTQVSLAQKSYYDLAKDRNLMLNVGGGIANYFGDFVNPGSLGIIRPNINVEAEYYWLDYVSLRTELGWFMLAGKDSKADDDRWERNLRFKSNALELNATAAIHLFPQISTFYPRPKINPYGFIGAGLMWNNPKTDYNGDNVALQPLRTEDIKYNRIQFVVPMGLGVKVQLNPYFNLIAQGGFRWTFTDHLDDVSRERYPNPIVLSSDLARMLSDRRAEIGTKPTDPQLGKRGNPDKNDHYMLLNLKLQYYLPVQIFPNRQNRAPKQKKSTVAPIVAAPIVAAPIIIPPADTDKDGIIDSLDRCPTLYGVPEYQGCPIPDTDGDGIVDPKDKCPRVPGLEKYEGCPIPDTDGDGINDEEDKCKNTPGIVSNKGCPEMIFYYKRDDANLTAAEKADLDKLVEWMGRHPELSISVEGHTSTLGTSEYNQTLSVKRAENTKKYLVSKGVDPNRLKTKGYGEKYPIGDNSVEAGRAKSRRVVMRIAD